MVKFVLVPFAFVWKFSWFVSYVYLFFYFDDFSLNDQVPIKNLLGVLFDSMKFTLLIRSLFPTLLKMPSLLVSSHLLIIPSYRLRSLFELGY